MASATQLSTAASIHVYASSCDCSMATSRASPFKYFGRQVARIRSQAPNLHTSPVRVDGFHDAVIRQRIQGDAINVSNNGGIN
jgi:hypothetical protein